MSADGVDAVLEAAATAFGFVCIHPFHDGSGRLHRCLVHHVVTERKYTPASLVFPISSAMFDCIDEYRKTLRSALVLALDNRLPIRKTSERKRTWIRLPNGS